MKKVVLQKFISGSGYCSRRKAENFIKEGCVTVNGEVAELGMRASADDVVKVLNDVIGLPEKKIYIKLNKPVEYTCTNRSFEGERNVFELLSEPQEVEAGENTPRRFAIPLSKREFFEGLHIVGRLDKNSSGLLLLTNDGDLTEKLTHPRYEHEKEYEVEVISRKEGIMINDDEIVKRLLAGVDISEGDGIVKAKKAKIIGENKFSLVLTEGKKRQIRRMFRALACEVIDLERVRIGSLELGDLGLGKWEYLGDKEIKELKNKKNI